MAKVTLSIDEETWKEFRILAIKSNKSASELIEEFMKNRLKAKKK